MPRGLFPRDTGTNLPRAPLISILFEKFFVNTCIYTASAKQITQQFVPE